MASGIWSQRELFDGTYDFLDLLEAHEFLDVKEENTRRQNEAARAARERADKHV